MSVPRPHNETPYDTHSNDQVLIICNAPNVETRSIHMRTNIAVNYSLNPQYNWCNMWVQYIYIYPIKDGVPCTISI